MNILFLCKKNPFSTQDGENLVIGSDAKSLHSLGHKIHYAFVETNEYNNEKYENSISKILNPSSLWSHVRSFFSKNPWQIQRFYNRKFSKEIIKYIDENKIDLIVCQGLAMTLYGQDIKRKKKLPILYRTHNLEFHIWYRMSKIETKRLKKIAYKFIARELEYYESKKLGFLTSVISINHLESAFFKTFYSSIPLETISLTLGETRPLYNTESKNILFVGSIDWRPNQQGLQWFIDDVYPHISDIPLTIAGKGSEALSQNYPNIFFIDNFLATDNLMETHRMMIVPLLSGGGIRIKLVEALRFGMPSVSTSIGAEDIQFQGSSITIADNAIDFANEIKKLYNEKSLLLKNSKEATQSYATYYSEEIILSKWKDIFTQFPGLS